MATADQIATRRRNAEAAAETAAKLRQQVIEKNKQKKPGLLDALTTKVKNIGTQPAPKSQDAMNISNRHEAEEAEGFKRKR